MITNEIKNRIKKVINVFEMGTTDIQYPKIYIYKDGPGKIRQITLSFGITEYGNLAKLVSLYVEKGGKYADELKPYIPKIGKKPLVNDERFKQLLIAASKEDELMRDAQNEIYDSVYWDKAYRWFKANGFTHPLSMAVIMDSMIHSGSILPFLRNRFKENTPAKGGDEKKWIQEYVKVRRAWLANHSNPILRNTVYRADFFKAQFAKNNWDFDCPLTAHGKKVC